MSDPEEIIHHYELAVVHLDKLRQMAFEQEHLPDSPQKEEQLKLYQERMAFARRAVMYRKNCFYGRSEHGI